MNGVAVAHITFEIRDGFRNAKIPVRWNAGSNRVELRYAVWNSHANDPRSMAVLFKRVASQLTLDFREVEPLVSDITS